MMKGASPKGRRSAPPKLAKAPLRACGAKRFSVQRKPAIVARLLRGEPLDLVARQTNVSVARLTEWRDRALAGAATALKERERDDRDDEIARLKSKVGEITMDNELLYAKIAAQRPQLRLLPPRCRAAPTDRSHYAEVGARELSRAPLSPESLARTAGFL